MLRANLLRQARAEGLKKLLPPPPPGWTADAAESTAVSVAMLGGGITASRAYHNGIQRVEVQIVTDSPMLQGLARADRQPARRDRRHEDRRDRWPAHVIYRERP